MNKGKFFAGESYARHITGGGKENEKKQSDDRIGNAPSSEELDFSSIVGWKKTPANTPSCITIYIHAFPISLLYSPSNTTFSSLSLFLSVYAFSSR